MSKKGSKSMFFKLCTMVFASFFLIIFFLEWKHGVVIFKEPHKTVLLVEIIISSGLVVFSFREVFEEWCEGEWFWK